jgi:hypothetical protein
VIDSIKAQCKELIRLSQFVYSTTKETIASVVSIYQGTEETPMIVPPHPIKTPDQNTKPPSALRHA